jgi:hypothetical protein
MSSRSGVKIADARRLLIERVASSRYVNRSARLRDLLRYLGDRVVDDDAGEIHEQEVGHKVFGRPADYDTTSDNIVRVHASMLRKRLEQYFSSEGAHEPLILEIPKGNYALVFRARTEPGIGFVSQPPEPATDWRLWPLALLSLLLACSTLFLLLRPSPQKNSVLPSSPSPSVRLFWSQVFRPDRPTDIVLDDAAVGLYQELTGKSLALSDYFDRDYLRSLPEAAAAAGLDRSAASSIVLRRHSNFADANFLWKLLQLPGVDQRHANLRFARDYSFRELKADNAVLLGNSRSNPWVESFEANLGLRWVYDKAAGVYYPVDMRMNTQGGGKSYHAEPSGDAHEGYCAISLVSNLGSSGSVLIVTSTGGSAMTACSDFLADEQSISELHRNLPGAASQGFPYFEALIKVKGRSTSPRDATVVVSRVLGK